MSGNDLLYWELGILGGGKHCLRWIIFSSSRISLGKVLKVTVVQIFNILRELCNIDG